MRRALAAGMFVAALAATAVGHRAGAEVGSDPIVVPPEQRTVCGCRTDADCLYGNFGCVGAGFQCDNNPYTGACINVPLAPSPGAP